MNSLQLHPLQAGLQPLQPAAAKVNATKLPPVCRGSLQHDRSAAPPRLLHRWDQ